MSAATTDTNMKDCSYTLRPTGQAFVEFPSIEIPDDSQISFDERNWPSFVIETSSGPITCRPTCRPTWWNIECTGSAEALSAYGLFSPEWMPGLPGNNKTRQSVIFTEDGPALAIGRYSRNQYSASAQYIVVVKHGKRAVIEVPITPDQKEWLRAMRDKRRNPPAPLPAMQPAQVIPITSRPRLQTGDYAYFHFPGHKNDGVVVMIGNEMYSEKGKFSITSLGMPFVFDDGSIGFEAYVPLDQLRRISSAFFERRPIFKVG